MAGGGVGVLTDDQNANGVQGRSERPQHVLTGWKVTTARGDLRAQELTDARDGCGLGFKGRQPRRVHQLGERTGGHGG